MLHRLAAGTSSSTPKRRRVPSAVQNSGRSSPASSRCAQPRADHNSGRWYPPSPMNSRHCRLLTGTRPIQNGPTSTVCAGRSLSSENGSLAASTPRVNGPPSTNTRSGRRAAGRQRPAPQQHGRALAQLQRGQHRLVVLLLVLHDHARREQLTGRGMLDQVKHPPANLVVIGPRLDGRQQRQRRALGSGVLERVVQRVHLRRQHAGPGRVAAAQQPQLLLLADMRQVPHQRADGTTFLCHRESPGNAWWACPARTEMRRRPRG